MNAHKRASNAFTISLLVNIALLTLLASLMFERGKRNSSLSSSGGEGSGDETYQLSKPSTLNAASTFNTPFHWRQIESTNYQTYIANLRRIGCPEQTIRDIITADLHAVYAALGDSGSDRPDRSTKEEKLALDELLGVAAQKQNQDVVNAGHPARPTRPASVSISMPLVLQPMPAGMQVTDEQVAIINGLRQQFQNDLGPVPADTTDPACRARWHRAQNNSDDLLAGMLGGEFYLQYQMQASAH